MPQHKDNKPRRYKKYNPGEQKQAEDEITKEYLEGSIGGEERYNKVVKVWTGVFVNVAIVFILTAAGFVGMVSFLMMMLLPIFEN